MTKPYLHEEIAAILANNANQWMTAREIAALVNRRGRYRKRDGSAVMPGQIAARIAKPKYSHMFERARTMRLSAQGDTDG